MRNDYEVRGDVTVIFMKSRKGVVRETLIETISLAKAISFPGSFAAVLNTYTNSYYAVGNLKNSEGVFKGKSLHRWLLDAPKGLEVDHINHETLDNRLSNLRMVTKKENQQNRRSANSNNNSSGLRGVWFDKRNQKWRAHAKLDGRKVHIGYYDTMEEANIAATEYRAHNMKKSLEFMEVCSD
jgi:hypothetical protein